MINSHQQTRSLFLLVVYKMIDTRGKNFCNKKLGLLVLSQIMVTLLTRDQGLTGRGFLTSGRDGSGTCQKVRVPGRVRTGSEKILKAKSTSIGPLIFIIDIITITFYETTI